VTWREQKGVGNLASLLRSYAATAFACFAPMTHRLAYQAVAREAGEDWWS